jgi:hypothetical protein
MARVPIAGAGPELFPVALGNKFCPDHRHLARGLDTQPNLPPLQADDSHADVVSDKELLHQLPSQHQHDVLPSNTDVIGSKRRCGGFGGASDSLL